MSVCAGVASGSAVIGLLVGIAATLAFIVSGLYDRIRIRYFQGIKKSKKTNQNTDPQKNNLDRTPSANCNSPVTQGCSMQLQDTPWVEVGDVPRYSPGYSNPGYSNLRYSNPGYSNPGYTQGTPNLSRLSSTGSEVNLIPTTPGPTPNAGRHTNSGVNHYSEVNLIPTTPGPTPNTRRHTNSGVNHFTLYGQARAPNLAKTYDSKAFNVQI